MTHGLRKLTLTLHVAASVGWLGAVAVFLALTVLGLTSQDQQTVRAVYIVAQPAVSFVIVPLAFTALVTGVIQSVGTPWGLLRHYWVLFKLLLTALATIVLVMYMPTLSHFAGAAAGADSVPASGLWSFLVHAGGALVVLMVNTALSVYKPRGLTPWQRF